MKRLHRLARAVLLLSLVFAAACTTRGGEPFPEGSASAKRLEPGPHAVGKTDMIFSDASRPIPKRGKDPGAPARVLKSTVWWPKAHAGPHPLVIYSHGFMSSRSEAAYLNQHLASRGYVVIAPNFPRSGMFAPGGPRLADVVNQPGDVSFLIDSALAWSDEESPYEGTIDRQRIAAVGLSLGGLTTTLAAYHPRWRDPRVRAAVSIAGPTLVFLPSFFRNADVPFLMIAGTSDAIVDFEDNAAPIPGLVRRGGLVEIDGGSHTGFAALADPFLRPLDNPDSLGCMALVKRLDENLADEETWELGSEEEGIAPAATVRAEPCRQNPLPGAISIPRQQEITTLAATAFLEGHLAQDRGERAAALDYLESQIPYEFSVVRFEGARAR